MKTPTEIVSTEVLQGPTGDFDTKLKDVQEEERRQVLRLWTKVPIGKRTTKRLVVLRTDGTG